VRISLKRFLPSPEDATSILMRLVSTFFLTILLYLFFAHLISGKLLHIVNQRSELNLELTMIGYGVPETRVAPAADLIRTCLRLDPDDRPSIRDLLHHPWLKNAHVCCGSA